MHEKFEEKIAEIASEVLIEIAPESLPYISMEKFINGLDSFRKFYRNFFINSREAFKKLLKLVQKFIEKNL